MKVTVSPSLLSGVIEAIPSKSHAHRLLICAALSDNKTDIACRTSSDDIKATCDCLCSLGATITKEKDFFLVTPLSASAQSAVLDCHESGSTYRFMAPVVAALGVNTEFVLQGRLGKRPMQPLWDALESHGVSVKGKDTERVCLSGKLRGGEFYIPGNVSSQFISGLIFALPLLDSDSVIYITGDLESKSYIDITLSAVRAFGIQINFAGRTITIPKGQKYISPRCVPVEGDWSNAAFWLCAAAAGKQSVTCAGLNPRSEQGDRAICNILRDFGAEVTIEENRVTARAAALFGTEVDARDIPDLIPAIAVLACSAPGTTVIKNAGRLRLKESDRLFTILDTLKKLGANISESENTLMIKGSRLAGGYVDSHNDHRIAMMASIASVISDGSITITKAEAVGKSYPGFFDDFKMLGGSIRKE